MSRGKSDSYSIRMRWTGNTGQGVGDEAEMMRAIVHRLGQLPGSL